jgi:hypothetical protein
MALAVQAVVVAMALKWWERGEEVHKHLDRLTRQPPIMRQSLALIHLGCRSGGSMHNEHTLYECNLNNFRVTSTMHTLLPPDSAGWTEVEEVEEGIILAVQCLLWNIAYRVNCPMPGMHMLEQYHLTFWGEKTMVVSVCVDNVTMCSLD